MTVNPNMHKTQPVPLYNPGQFGFGRSQLSDLARPADVLYCSSSFQPASRTVTAGCACDVIVMANGRQMLLLYKRYLRLYKIISQILQKYTRNVNKFPFDKVCGINTITV